MSVKSCSSSSSTTSLGQNGASAGLTWCFTPPNALFFRRRAPRLWNKVGFRPVGRGASLPTTPYSFVDGHHVFGTKWGFARLNVVLRSPQNLVLPSTGTTSACALNKKPTSGKQSPFKLTLMKGDEVVELLEEAAYLLLFFDALRDSYILLLHPFFGNVNHRRTILA